jgi:hypothetical protein
VRKKPDAPGFVLRKTWLRPASLSPKRIPNPDAEIQPPMFEVLGDDLLQTVLFGISPKMSVEP